MFYISFWKSFLVMTSIQEVVYGVDLASVLKRLDVYHELGGVGRWELQIDEIFADALTSEGAGSVSAKSQFRTEKKRRQMRLQAYLLVAKYASRRRKI
jgi:hypothetical protein